MRIKRTFAATMREALLLVKQEQGADAVILGNKKVPGGVELISAIDFDETDVNRIQTPVEPSRRVAPHSNESGSVSSKQAELQSDTWSGSMMTDPLHGRKEPTLGPVVNNGVKPVVQPARPPAWLERELERAETQVADRTQAKPQMPQEPISTRPTVRAPVHGTIARQVKPRPGIRSESGRRLKTAQSQSEVRPVSRGEASSSDAMPMIEEVRHELKGLRDLMESQLSVMQWDKFSERHPVRTVLLNLMSELGLGTDICEIVMSHLDQINDDPHKVWQQALGIVAKCLPVSRHDLLSDGGRIALVGSTGVGKTTTIAKLAARFAHNHGKRSVAMISTDHFRIGAQEQLQHFARLLEIPLLMANSGEELADRLDMLADKRLVLIDTAGMSQQDLRLSERFHELQHAAPQIKPYLVLSANTQLAALNQTILSFAKVPLAGAFVTKLDEAASLGGIITAAIRHQLALTYCGTGQRVPEDLEAAKNHRIVSKAVALMQQYSEREGKETLAQRYNHIINRNQG